MGRAATLTRCVLRTDLVGVVRREHALHRAHLPRRHEALRLPGAPHHLHLRLLPRHLRLLHRRLRARGQGPCRLCSLHRCRSFQGLAK